MERTSQASQRISSGDSAAKRLLGEKGEDH